LVTAKGITLIIVPFWWNFDANRYFLIGFSFSSYCFFFTTSLIATIKESRSDLLTTTSTTALPLSEQVPDEIIEKYKQGIVNNRITSCDLNNNFSAIPGLGMPTFVMHAPPMFDPTNW
jgi:hypothetical protein